MPLFEVDADIRKAKTLASDFYTDPAYFEYSKERIFSRFWHFLGRKDEFETLKPVNLLPGFLDEPFLLSRSGETVRCVSNVCTHRGKILVEEPCKANLIRCGYHGRRFSLDGRFLSMPEFDGVEGFPSDSDDLKQIPLETWNGFLFASLDPISAFRDLISDAVENLTVLHTKEVRFIAKREYEVNAHWALYCENYLEGFHIPYVHKALNEVVDYGTYSTETFRYSSLQTGYDDAGNVAAEYLFVFPNLMFNFYPWGISVNMVRPITQSRTTVEFLTYVSDDRLMNEGAGADLHGVEMEDEAVVESVQKGIRSRFYKHGRYSPTREQGTHHFHRLISEFLG